MQRSALSVGLMIDFDVWVAEKDAHAVDSPKPARFSQRGSLQTRLLIRVQAKAEQVLQALKRAETRSDVNRVPLIFDRSVLEPSALLDEELDHLELVLGDRFEKRSFTVDVFQIEVEVGQSFEKSEQLHVLFLHRNVCRCQLLVRTFARPDCPRIQGCDLARQPQISLANGLQELGR